MRIGVSLFCLAFIVTASASAAPEYPALVVSCLTYSPPYLSINLQNQSHQPASGKTRLQLGVRAGKSVQIELPTPQSPLSTSSGRFDIRQLGIDPANFTALFQVKIQGEDSYLYTQQVDCSNSEPHGERAPYRPGPPGQWPDLVITKVYWDGGDYLKVVYKNQGKGRTGSDFLIRLRFGEKEFAGNEFYRFPVPRPGQSVETGGITVGLLGLKKGSRGPLTAEIDPERRVCETDRGNNVWQGTIDLRPHHR